jgi:protein-S-isoprenylcysteine O-methyltransferase Ste14
LFGCAAPAALFGLLGWYNLVRLHDQLVGRDRPHSFSDLLAGPLERALYLAFVSIPVVIYVTRPRALQRSGGIGPRTAAFAGTTILLVFPAFFDQGPTILEPPAFVHAVAGVLVIGGTAFGVWGLLYLRHSFSIIPEARRLVIGGPYRIVRHPLYFAEITISIGLAFQGDLHLWSTLILGPFICLQLVRSLYEERLLRDAFPEYEDYARRTRGLIPGLP